MNLDMLGVDLCVCVHVALNSVMFVECLLRWNGFGVGLCLLLQ